MEYINKEKNIKIYANEINIGDSVKFGNNISVIVNGRFELNNYSVLGDNAVIRGNNVIIGEHFFNSNDLRIGGGGWDGPNANLVIGDRCVIHNSLINICEPVEIGDDVGFSTHVDIITHGFWLSVLEGFPTTFSGVKIGNGVIVGLRSTIMMGVNITDEIVIGARSLVTNNLSEKGIYVGIPARKIKDIIPLQPAQRIETINNIIKKYVKVAKYHKIKPSISIEYPVIFINDFQINVETLEYEGKEDEETDDFRDFMRRYGIRIYTKRFFKTSFKFPFN
jgi:acetyltransferase-like isoleucine patch superfamily enzyme